MATNHRTARGVPIDMDRIRLSNETTIAVGNMNVNARGDRLDSMNRVIDSKNQQLQRQHQKQIASNVNDHPVHTSNVSAKKARSQTENAVPPIITPDPVDITPPIDNNSSETPKGGLAAAIARSRTVAQEKEKTPRELKQSKPGVNRI